MAIIPERFWLLLSICDCGLLWGKGQELVAWATDEKGAAACHSALCSFFEDEIGIIENYRKFPHFWKFQVGHDREKFGSRKNLFL